MASVLQSWAPEIDNDTSLPLCADRVVMVEEAGEILEAHILTSMAPSTKHLIMIGG